MAKKQPRKSKKSVNKPLTQVSVASQADSADSNLFKSSDWPIFASIIFAGAFAVYFFLFLVTETSVGGRFGIYLSLSLNPSIYWAYWTGSPTGEIMLFDRWPIIAGVTFHFLLALGIGKFVLLATNLGKDLTPLEALTLAVGIGLSLISTLTFLLGCFQLYGLKQLCVLPSLILSLFGFAFWFKKLQKTTTMDAALQGESRPDSSQAASIESLGGEGEWNSAKPSLAWNAVLILAIPFGMMIVLGSMIPPWEFDVREYHLQVPKEWFQQGGVTFLPHNVYGNMPLGTEMHALTAMLYSFGDNDWWWGAVIGKTVSGCFAILSAMALYSVGRRLFGSFAGASAAVVYIGTPWITANSIIGYNECALAFYLLAAMLLLIVDIQNNRLRVASETENTTDVPQTGRKFGCNLLLFGFLLGSAVAAKYTGAVFIVIPGILVYIGLRYSQIQTPVPSLVKQTGVICIGLALSCGPWFVKNATLIGNPVYPLAESVFQSTQSSGQITQWKAAHSVSGQQMSFDQMRSSIKSLLFKYKWLSSLLFPLACLAFFRLKHLRAVWLLIGFLVFCFFVWWTLTHRLERFLLPIYPIACLLAGAGAAWSRHKVWLTVVTVLLMIGTGCNLLIATSRMVGDVRVFAPLSHLNLSEPTAKDYFHPDGLIAPLNQRTPAIVWLNKNRPDAKVLFLGECRPFYARFDVIYNTCFDDCETWKRLKGRSSSELQDALINEGITHLFVNWAELKRLQTTYGYNVVDPNFEYSAIRNLNGTVLRNVSEANLPDALGLYEVVNPQD